MWETLIRENNHDFGAKYKKKKLDHNRKTKPMTNLEKELQSVEEGLKVKIHFDSPKKTLKKYQIGKLLAMMPYMDTGLKIHFHKWQTGYQNE